MSLLMGLALLGGLLYCCLRMCCGVCGGSGGGMSNMCDCRQYGRQQRRARYPPRQVTPDEPPRKYRPPSPRQPTPPPKIIERQPQYIRTVARPISYGQFPGGGGYMRPQPILPGYFP
ncbi:hypothetical protein DPMN_047299 [Dreissena polymorpha]|uniref:Secreted protein n=1 Tax=Dreissena polymorpha TaxID=45954 RepID=A0A9D4D7T6_DREPO|nr:hypothetical protein DPMN_047299 [Dreissena polymorpha]